MAFAQLDFTHPSRLGTGPDTSPRPMSRSFWRASDPALGKLRAEATRENLTPGSGVS